MLFAQLLLVWVIVFVGGMLVGYALGQGRTDPPRWWERPWPTGPVDEPSWGAVPERERTRR